MEFDRLLPYGATRWPRRYLPPLYPTSHAILVCAISDRSPQRSCKWSTLLLEFETW